MIKHKKGFYRPAPMLDGWYIDRTYQTAKSERRVKFTLDCSLVPIKANRLIMFKVVDGELRIRPIRKVVAG